MERKFYGLNRAEMNEVLNVMCDLEERVTFLTQEEEKAYDIAIQCVCQIVNRMADDKPINWD